MVAPSGASANIQLVHFLLGQDLDSFHEPERIDMNLVAFLIHRELVSLVRLVDPILRFVRNIPTNHARVLRGFVSVSLVV